MCVEITSVVAHEYEPRYAWITYVARCMCSVTCKCACVGWSGACVGCGVLGGNVLRDAATPVLLSIVMCDVVRCPGPCVACVS